MSALMSDDFILDAEQYDEFKMWQGLIGPYYYPSVDYAGNLSWTNNGGLSNPATVNIQGRGLTIVGIVEDPSDLPETADDYVTYLVGDEAPYNGYIYDNGNWVDLGLVGASAGFGTPTATIDSTVGTPSVTVTASGPDTAKVFSFAFSNLKGEPGQGSPGTSTPLADTTGGAVGSSTSYSREDHQHPLNVPTSGTPEMDGTASQGSAATYARSDHVHPTDTSRASTTDLSTVSGNLSSLQGSFKGFTVTLASASWVSNEQTVSDAKFIASGYSYIVSPASASFADYGAAQIYADNVTTDGSMTFHCTDVPSSNLTVNVVRMVAS